MKPTEKEVKLKINTLALNMSNPAIPASERKAMRQEWLSLRELLKWLTGAK